MRQLIQLLKQSYKVSATLIVTMLLFISLLSLLSGTLPVHSAPTTPEIFGSIAGQVTDAAGNPLAGITVQLYRRYEYGSYSPTDRVATTDTNGRYRMALVTTGIYIVYFRDPAGTYTTQYYPATDQIEKAMDISVAGNALSGIDTTLQVAGQISGLVTTTEDLQMGAIEVSALRLPPAAPHTESQILAPGEQHFRIGGLRAGVYVVCAHGTTTEVYRPYFFQECYDDYLAYPSYPINYPFTPITVSAGSLISNVNFIFGDDTNLVAIHGVVMTMDGQRLSETSVILWQDTQGSGRDVRDTQSSADGSFHFLHLNPGRYVLSFMEPTGNYIFEQQPAGLAHSNVITVNLPVGGEQQTVTATLVPSAQLTGVVTLQEEALPSQYSSITLYEYGDASEEGRVTRAAIDPLTGHYVMKGIPAGTYQLHAEDQRDNVYFTGAYGANQGADPAPIRLTSGERKQNMNFALYATHDPYQGLISGTVTAQGQPLAGIKVQLHHDTFDGPTPVAFTFTDAKGNYQLRGLPSTAYFVGFSDPKQVYGLTFYPNQRLGSSLDTFCHTLVCPNVNAELKLGGIIEGHVHQSTGEPVTHATVNAYWREGDRWISGFGFAAFIDETGYYQLPALVPDTYRLGIFAQVGHPTKEYYDNASSVESATDLVVRAGTVLQADVVIGPRVIISTAYLPLLQR